MPALARTLMTVADDRSGAMALYNGSLTGRFLQDLQLAGSLITREDLALYRANWYEPITAQLNGGYMLYTAPPPASGSVLASILQTLEGQLQPNPRINVFNTLRVAEAFKYAYALRTELGDPAFTDTNRVLQKSMSENYISNVASKLHQLTRTESYPEYYGASYHSGNSGGTINIVVQAQDGDAVVATSTINTLFGSLMASPSTGIILNNEMDDFSSPQIVNSFGVTPSSANFIQGGKRPLSSAAPSIIVAPNGDVRLAIGSAGGTHITSAVAQVIINHLWFGMSIKQAVDMPRIHHQLLPMVLKYEYGIPKSVIDGLARAGHRTKQMSPHSSVTAVATLNDQVTAIYDYRRGGNTSGF
ncbi:hypothetical protein GE061_009567 [Apolygus lucorum]|uniref:Gamma-glutamyltranspeptidase 1 n=1 Tax=Apolygus lucorum TaxID=248454 RepID=A0A8S9Y1W3_APOLU|nr:hypothetical protein GE061_009567 [Apolygus lucorum]